jgi:hypothetical protein
MSEDILVSLGYDLDDMHWQDLAACKGMVQVSELPDGSVDIFDPMFDSYENDSFPFALRLAVDNMCVSCPVQKICYEFGVENKEPGVWGGVYLTNGKHDSAKNEHKGKDLWSRVLAGVK